MDYLEAFERCWIKNMKGGSIISYPKKISCDFKESMEVQNLKILFPKVITTICKLALS